MMRFLGGLSFSSNFGRYLNLIDIEGVLEKFSGKIYALMPEMKLFCEI